MSRKHFARLAWALRQEHPRLVGSLDPASEAYFYAEAQWCATAEAIAEACAESNGRFDRGRFYRAAGLELRPDGSMYPMAAPR